LSVGAALNRERFNRESGQAIVLVVVSLGLFMLGALGLGIDGAQMYAHRQMAQAAADAAAEAAIMSIARGTNSTSAHPFSTAASFTCAVPPATLDLRTPCIYAQYNGFGTSTDTVTVSFPATISGVTLSSGATPAVSVSVQRVLTAGLIRFAGITTYTIKATASAGILASVPATCLYILDPSAPDAFTASNGASVTMNCGLVINDTNAVAASITGGGNGHCVRDFHRRGLCCQQRWDRFARSDHRNRGSGRPLRFSGWTHPQCL
jgi:Flp pilus assembly protein TadG